MSNGIGLDAFLRPGALVAAVILLAASQVIAGAPPRVRGVVTGVGTNFIRVQVGGGSEVTLQTGSNTIYANVVRSGLKEIKINDFVGTAVKGPPNSMIAVELVIIPKTMRAGRIGYYGWDPLPDPTADPISVITATSMTNGFVSTVSAPAPQRANRNVTDGVVLDERGGSAGLILAVTADATGQRFRITVPYNAPITRYELAGRSIVAVGSRVFVKTNRGNLAGLVTVGKGITPPQ